MKAQAVRNNNINSSSMFTTMARGAVVGTASGLVFKYAYPFTPEEKLSDEFIKVTNTINTKEGKSGFKTLEILKAIKSKLKIAKAIRPTGFFLATGAVVGAGIAATLRAMETEVKNPV